MTRAPQGWPGRIVVLGGGTAGRLDAMMPEREAALRLSATSVTEVDPRRLGVIGVGEGFAAVLTMVLRRAWLPSLRERIAA